MKYKAPKTRIKVTKKVNGDTTYQPQYEMLFFMWEGMSGQFFSDGKVCYNNLKQAQERIDKFLVDTEGYHNQDVGETVASVEYVKYP